MKVLFTGGGTAGHINPALAAAGYLLQKEPDAQILYVGNKGGMEERLVAQAGYDMKTVHISGFQRKLTPKNLWRNAQTVVRVFTATVEAIAEALTREEKVQLVGFGSFEVKTRAARVGRNPKTGTEIEIPQTKTPVFKAGKALKDAVAQ